MSAFAEPRVWDIIRRLGKSYVPIAVPKGLPRYRMLHGCYRNAAYAVLDDHRLTYVEGLARGWVTGNIFISHAWVTLDSEQAIDLTWRGQRVPLYRPGRGPADEAERYTIMEPATEYYGVEISWQVVANFMLTRNSVGQILDQYVNLENVTTGALNALTCP